MLLLRQRSARTHNSFAEPRLLNPRLIIPGSARHIDVGRGVFKPSTFGRFNLESRSLRSSEFGGGRSSEVPYNRTLERGHSNCPLYLYGRCPFYGGSIFGGFTVYPGNKHKIIMFIMFMNSAPVYMQDKTFQ